MYKLKSEIKNYAQLLGHDASKQLKIAQYHNAYANAIMHVCQNNYRIADLIFEHTNAFYVRKVDAIRKGSGKDQPYIVCEVCIDDPLIRSELNSYRELIKLALQYNNIHCDEFKIIPAKGGMKERHPFQKFKSTEVQLTTSSLQSKPSTQELNQIDQTAAIKRALCLTYGEDAYLILDQVCKAELILVKSQANHAQRQQFRNYWMQLFVTNKYIENLVKGSSDNICAKARELGLNIRSINVCIADDTMNHQRAFPHVNER